MLSDLLLNRCCPAIFCHIFGLHVKHSSIQKKSPHGPRPPSKCGPSMLKTPASKWRSSFVKIRLQLLVYKPLSSGKMAKTLKKRMDEYEALITCHPPFNSRTATADELFPVTAAMLEQKNWSMKSIQPAVDALKGVLSIHTRGSTSEAIAALNKFHPLFEDFVDCHPALSGQLDPWFVQYLGIPPVGGWQGPHYSAQSTDHPAGAAVINANNQIWSFHSRHDAEFFLGQISERGQVAVTYNSLIAPIFP